METRLNELKTRLAEIDDLELAASVLGWDQNTYMPPGGAPARGRQIATLHTWLKEKIYQHGRKYTAPELIERITGGPLSIEPYIRYLRTKYGELYEL